MAGGSSRRFGNTIHSCLVELVSSSFATTMTKPPGSVRNSSETLRNARIATHTSSSYTMCLVWNPCSEHPSASQAHCTRAVYEIRFASMPYHNVLAKE
nr:hypothetical protein CFP56_73560 [Quercus suber]